MEKFVVFFICFIKYKSVVVLCKQRKSGKLHKSMSNLEKSTLKFAKTCKVWPYYKNIYFSEFWVDCTLRATLYTFHYFHLGLNRWKQGCKCLKPENRCRGQSSSRWKSLWFGYSQAIHPCSYKPQKDPREPHCPPISHSHWENLQSPKSERNKIFVSVCTCR